MTSILATLLLLIGGLTIVPTDMRELPSRSGWSSDTATSSALCTSFSGYRDSNGDTNTYAWCLSKYDVAYVCVKQKYVSNRLSDVWMAYTVRDDAELQDYVREQYFELYGEWGRFYMATEDGWNYYKSDSILAIVALEDSDTATTMLILWSNLNVSE